MSDGEESLEAFRGRLYGSAVSTYVVCMIVVPLKLWCRIHKTGAASLGWDDALCITALVLVNAFFYLGMLGLGPNLGKHLGSEVSMEQLARFLVFLFPEQLLYLVCVAANKFALISFYWRLFSIRARVPLLIMTAVVAIWLVGLVLAVVFTCEPVAAQWDLKVTGKCNGLRELYLGGSVPNIVTDAVLLIMPLPYVWRLNIQPAQRLMLTSIFLLGCFVIVVSVVRLINLMAVDLASPDYTWKMKEVLLWSVVEVNVGLICACLPSLKPAVKMLGLNRIFGSTHGTADNGRLTPTPMHSPAFIASEKARSRRKSSSGRLFQSLSAFTTTRDERDGDSLEMMNKASNSRGTVETSIGPGTDEHSEGPGWPLPSRISPSGIEMKSTWSVEVESQSPRK